MKTLILVLALSSLAQAQDAWRPTKAMLYTRPEKHTRVLQSLGLMKGEWTIVVVRTGCGDCERAVERTNDSPRTVFMVDGNAKAWAKQFGLKRARVVASTDEQRSLLGVLWLPTFIKVVNGRVVGTHP